MSWSLCTSMFVVFSQSLMSFALSWFIQSTVLIIAGLITARLLIRRGSAVQFVIFSTTLAAVMICPLVTSMLSLAGMTQWSVISPVPSPAKVETPLEPRQINNPVDELITHSSVPQIGDRSVRSVRQPHEPAPMAETSTADLISSYSEAVDSSVEPSHPTTAPAEISSTGRATLPVPKDRQRQSQSTMLSLVRTDFVMVGGCLIWISLSGWFLARLAVAWSRLIRICRCAFLADRRTMQMCEELALRMGVTAPEVLHTPFLPSPCLAGLFHPVVLLPEADLTSLMRNVLIHELAHVRRRDYQWQLLRTLATSLFWFQPLLWVLSHQMEMAAEEVCDDFVVEFGADRAKYAHCLIDVAEFSTATVAVAGVAMVSFQSMLTRRVKRIMDTTRLLSTRTSHRLVTSTFVVGCVFTLIIGLLGVTPPMSAESATAKLSTTDPTATNDSANLASTDTKIAPVIETVQPDQSSTTENLIAAGPKYKPEGANSVTSGPIPGILSAPPLLTGGRRWQMYTKNANSSASSVCWSPNGRLLAIASGQFVRLYDFQESPPEFKIILAGHSDVIKSVRFSAQGDRLATAANDGTVRIWDVDGRQLFVYREHEDAVLDVSWHPDGTRLASGSLDGTARIWTAEGKTDAVLSDHEAPVTAVAWNPNGKLLTTGCENKTIRYWNEQGQPGPVVDAHIGPVRALAWNSDGSQLLSCDFGIESNNENEEDRAHIKVWDLEGKPISSVLVNRPLSYAAWSPDGKEAVAGGWRSVYKWKIGDRQVVRLPALGNGLVPVAWRPSGESIAAGPMLLHTSGALLPSPPLRDISLSSTGLNADGSILGIGRTNGGFDLFSSDGQQRFHSGSNAQNGYSQVQAISWSPDGQSFVAASRYLQVFQRYDTMGKPTGNPINLPGDTRSVTFSRDGKLAATAGDLMVVALVNIETGKATRIGKQKQGVTQVRFTPDQQQICSAGYDSCIRFWSLDGKPLKVLETIGAPIDALAWSSDGQVMATGHQDETIRLWNADGELQTVVGGHGGYVETLEFNPEGTLLASGSRDNSVRLWKRDGTPVATLRGHLGAVFGLSWTSDGRKIYSCSQDGTIRLWNVETGMAEWQTLLSDANGFVTVDARGKVLHGNEQILESDFVFFVEDNQRRLARTSLAEIRSTLVAEGSASTN